MFRNLQKILCGLEEATYGTDPSPSVGTDDIDAKNIVVNYPTEKLDRDLQRESLSPKNPITGKKWIEISFTCELKGSGTHGTAPQIGDLLEACGFSESIGEDGGGSSSVVYTPASMGHKSITFNLYEVNASSGGDYIKHTIKGARGDVNFAFEAGQIARAEFTFQGLYTKPSDIADPGDPSYESSSPPIVDSLSLSYGGNSDLVAQAVNIALGNDVSEKPDLNTQYGIAGYRINGRTPTGDFNPEAVLLATYDFWQDLVNSEKNALSLTLGSTQGNILEVSAPKVTLDNIDQGERNGITTKEIPFTLGMDAGDDELSLAFK